MTKAKNKKLVVKPPNLLVALIRQLLFQRLGVFALITVTLLSAFSLVLVAHEKRQLFAQLNELNKERDQLDIEFRELRLEQRIQADPTRLQEIATTQLQMKTLDLKTERIIKRINDSE